MGYYQKPTEAVYTLSIKGTIGSLLPETVHVANYERQNSNQLPWTTIRMEAGWNILKQKIEYKFL
jgi:hypothetical protein